MTPNEFVLYSIFLSLGYFIGYVIGHSCGVDHTVNFYRKKLIEYGLGEFFVKDNELRFRVFSNKNE